jgi:anti-sigma regulatory factor (Ser/Thr protein kinase)
MLGFNIVRAREPSDQERERAQSRHHMHREIELPRGPDAPRQAREALAEWYGDSLAAEELANGKLLVSELATNAVIHGTGRIRLSAELDEDRLRVEVRDEGSEFEAAARRMTSREPRAYGLTIVEGLSSRWGIHEGTTHVWAEIERAGPRLGAQRHTES